MILLMNLLSFLVVLDNLRDQILFPIEMGRILSSSTSSSSTSSVSSSSATTANGESLNSTTHNIQLDRTEEK